MTNTIPCKVTSQPLIQFIFSGGVIAFQKQPPRCERITLVEGVPLDVIFVNSGVSRETSRLVAKVRELLTRLPKVMQSIMETFDQIALEAINQLKSKQGYDRAKLKVSIFILLFIISDLDNL